jgi:hypothetical protein
MRHFVVVICFLNREREEKKEKREKKGGLQESFFFCRWLSESHFFLFQKNSQRGKDVKRVVS